MPPDPLVPAAAVNAFVNAVARSVAVGPAGMLIADATAVAISVGVNVALENVAFS